MAAGRVGGPPTGSVRRGREQGRPFSHARLISGAQLRVPAPSTTPAPPRPGPRCLRAPGTCPSADARGGGVIALAPSFSTVYNLLLCLHIFSVHIIHQSKKRNYDNLDQLSYDNKRGPKVYMHGLHATHRRGRPGASQRPSPARPGERRPSSEESEVREAAAGSRGQARPRGCPAGPSRGRADVRAAAAGGAASGGACESLGPPGFPRGTQEGARPSSRPPACWGPGHSAGACGSGLRGAPVVWAESAPSLLPVAFQTSSRLSPLHALCVSAHPVACSAHSGPSDRWRERSESRRSAGQRAGAGRTSEVRPGQAAGRRVDRAGGRCRPGSPSGAASDS